MDRDLLTEKLIGCAIEVHRILGPGPLESAHEQCLARELALQGIGCELQIPVPVEYKGVRLDCGYRIDVLANDQLILELKALETNLGIDKAQLLSYMKQSGISTGLLLNFNVQLLKDGITRFKL